MTQDAAEPKEKESETNIKETIESILIAFILAFIFRAFIVEAFVIPTGSMAPTLMGAHMRFRCEDCGYEWTVNFPTNSEGDDVTIPSRAYLLTRDGRIVVDDSKRPVSRTYHLNCPNCGYQVPRFNDANPDNSATSPPVHYGDRILVLKYLYLFQQPKRWDVVVFKSPEQPYKYDYQQNYIKRLIGRPGETIMLLDGDVYVAPNVADKDPTADDFAVQTKPRNVQDALWRVVYDNDYYPQNKASDRSNGKARAWKQPWTAQAGQRGWTLNGRDFTFDNTTGAADIFFDASANPDKHSLTDWLAYDITVDQSATRRDSYDDPTYTPDDNVSDVRLSFFYQRTGGDGAITASLSKLDRTFIAEITPGKATLFQRFPNAAPQVLASVSLDVDTTKPTRIDLINCDYQVTMRVNDKQVLQTTPQQYHPDVHYLLSAFARHDKLDKPSIHIAAANQKCTISHLSLWRDVYYMNRVPNFSGGRLTWAVPDQFPDNLMRLKADPPEYFCCGDNSPISGDGRYWQTDINLPDEDLVVESGRVPGRFLLGKAFFVYWPAGFRPVEQAPALVPNFGDMRFIH